MNNVVPAEALVAMPLDQMVLKLGMAVAKANRAMAETAGGSADDTMTYTIPDAEITLKVAIAVDQKTDAGGKLELGLKGFSVNATYAKSFAFKEEASSEIHIKLKAVPRAQV